MFLALHFQLLTIQLMPIYLHSLVKYGFVLQITVADLWDVQHNRQALQMDDHLATFFGQHLTPYNNSS